MNSLNYLLVYLLRIRSEQRFVFHECEHKLHGITSRNDENR